MSIDVLVFIGPHGAGKTTVGRAVAARLGWCFDAEIGAALRAECLRRDPGQHALVAQDDFDEEVFSRELARDGARRAPAVVETWHPGNVAYASNRSPAVVSAWFPRLTSHVRRLASRVLVQPLRIERETALRRLSEPGPDADQTVDFFLCVGTTAERLATRWGLTMLPPIATDTLTPEEVCTLVLERVST